MVMLIWESSRSPPMRSFSFWRHVNTLCLELRVAGEVEIDGALPMIEVSDTRRADGPVTGLFDFTDPGRRVTGRAGVFETGLAAGDADGRGRPLDVLSERTPSSGRGRPPANSQLSAAMPSPEDAQALLPR